MSHLEDSVKKESCSHNTLPRTTMEQTPIAAEQRSRQHTVTVFILSAVESFM